MLCGTPTTYQIFITSCRLQKNLLRGIPNHKEYNSRCNLRTNEVYQSKNKTKRILKKDIIVEPYCLLKAIKI